jgi:plasmid stabilization system protein ParE
MKPLKNWGKSSATLPGTLGSFPQLGKVFRKLNREDVREISVSPHRIIYHVKDLERSVRILKVWHGARQEPEI